MLTNNIQTLNGKNNIFNFSNSLHLNDYCFIHQNIRSVRKNLDSFTCELHTLHLRPQINFLSEIFILDNESSCYKINKYNCFTNCNEKK